ncbi:tetratricopeptide repeat protein [Crocosphaera sp. Alani8]|uniref:tetratricopeptide repeat protein n=1 Tax=Crocosphaera sp. Alani8 TaxID=3038952 RepID=UPI00313E6243
MKTKSLFVAGLSCLTFAGFLTPAFASDMAKTSSPPELGITLSLSSVPTTSIGSSSLLITTAQHRDNPSLLSQVPQEENPYDTYMRLGFASMERKDYHSAVDYFRDALFYSPEDREATIAYWNARKALHNTISPSDRTPPESNYDRFMRLAYDETNQRDYQSALINFNRALKQRPGDYFATQAIRNVSSYIAGEKGESLRDVEALAVNLPDNHYVGESSYDRYMRLGYGAAKENNHLMAADYFRSALSERPHDRLATIAFWNMKHNLNQQTSEVAQSNNERLYDQYMRLGYDATQKHHFQQALTYFEQALQVKPNDEYATQAVRNINTYILESVN